jgi:Nucleotidyltransferase domain
MSGSEIAAYGRELVERLRQALGDELVGVYAGGSLALGDYEHGRSDIDVAAVVRRPLDRGRKEEIVAAVRHEALACPGRGLELVVYTEDAARRSGVDPGFELNLNTGTGMAFRADLEPGEEETHWFAVDRSILAGHGVALFGPPARAIFAPIERQALLAVLGEGLRWWGAAAPANPDAVLNASRSLHFAVTRRWTSKRRAAAWAAERGLEPDLVAGALAAREDGAALEPERVRVFLAAVAARLRYESR